ncbi:hypothetical protein GRJ2_001790600 [Grus japonensis]|uniref:Uncharacterized protein n=1 Tax=Grus japonensis TaxID=30415 RepID=A0ABC9X6G4_GRUJA
MLLQRVRKSLPPEELPGIEEDRLSSLKPYQPAKGSPLGSASYVFADGYNATISLLVRKQRKETATELFERSKPELDNYPSPVVIDLPCSKPQLSLSSYQKGTQLMKMAMTMKKSFGEGGGPSSSLG